MYHFFSDSLLGARPRISKTLGNSDVEVRCFLLLYVHMLVENLLLLCSKNVTITLTYKVPKLLTLDNEKVDIFCENCNKRTQF